MIFTFSCMFFLQLTSFMSKASPILHGQYPVNFIIITENPTIIMMVTKIPLMYRIYESLKTILLYLPICNKLIFCGYLQLLFLMVIAVYITSQVNTNVVMNVKGGLYNQRPSCGFLSLYSTE